MHEIDFDNLELHQKYYMENNKHTFRHLGYFSGYVNHTNHNNHIVKYAIFINIQRIKMNKKSIYIKQFVSYRNKKHWKYYIPQKDTIIQKFEKNTLHLILTNIINDPSFIYY
jgi:hypothetical protein